MGNANSCCASSTEGETPESTVADAAPPVEEMNSKMEEKKNGDQRPQMVLRFITQNGSSKDVTFTERSLGIDFSDPRPGLPLICKRLKPGMQAERNEVKVGWCLSHINGVPVPVDECVPPTYSKEVKRSANMNETLRMLQEGIKILPHA